MAKDYEHFPRQGFLVLGVLKFLEGKEWNEVVMAFVQSLRPSYVQVIEFGQPVYTDARPWRVTVYLAAGNSLVSRITQEVIVGLPRGIDNGHALELTLAGLPVPKPDENGIYGYTNFPNRRT